MVLTQGFTKKVGPCGGSGGSVRDMNINGITRIVKISVRHYGAIDALTVRFIRNGSEESTELWGGQGGRLTEFNLQASEYITSVKGYFSSYNNNYVVLRSLKFETNLGSFGPYGTQEGIPFELPAIGGQIIGFHGRSGGLLDALGVYVQVPTQGLTKKVGPCGGSGGSVRDMNINGITRIIKISVRHAGAIDALTVRFLRNDCEECTQLWGGQGGYLTEFNLQASEYIISVKGRVGTYNNAVVLRSLAFETNLRSFGPYGTQEGIPFELPAIGGQIIGFYGRSGGLLDALGVYVQDREGIVRNELEDCKQKLKNKEAEYLKNVKELRVQLDSKDGLQKRLESKIEHLENENELLLKKIESKSTDDRMEEHRGCIAFFATYRPPVPLDIFSCPVAPLTEKDELNLTDGMSYNYNCQIIPPAALKTIINSTKLTSEATEADINSGRLTGLIFVSERDDNIETLHIALSFNDKPHKVKVFSLADIYGTNSFNGVRLEDSGCIGGGYKMGNRTVDHFLIYVSTKEKVQVRRCPWTVVYKTNLRTGETERLTPPGIFDLSPSVSPSGKKIAVASFQGKAWDGEIEDLKTDIYVMNVDNSNMGLQRKRVIENGGWPTWGSENILFFHRKEYYGTKPKDPTAWRVFQFNISTKETIPVTPKDIDAVTPAAINETKVAVATMRMKSELKDERNEDQYRHIEIFDTTEPKNPQRITQKTNPKADHFNPFIIDAGKRIGYHRCRFGTSLINSIVAKDFDKIHSPHEDVGLFRVSGAFPTFSKDGEKLAFVDNEFRNVWVADSQGLRIALEGKDRGNFFSPVWNQNPDLDTLYVCKGKAFTKGEQLDIVAISNVSSGKVEARQLTKGFNNAFPSTDPQGKRLVFRSTRCGGVEFNKNLYIMEDAKVGECGTGKITRLTNGPWTDTHCQWSPNGNWIVFSSTRDKPKDGGIPKSDNDLDPGYFAVFLVNVNNPNVVVRVIQSGADIAGHVNHPVFSPDGKSIAVTSDLAAVSAEPISLPLLAHSVRPYGDIFTVDIDPDDINKNKDVREFHRITHSRYENSTPSWTKFSTKDPNAKWNGRLLKGPNYVPSCPYIYPDGGEGWHMTGQLCIGKRCC